MKKYVVAIALMISCVSLFGCKEEKNVERVQDSTEVEVKAEVEPKNKSVSEQISLIAEKLAVMASEKQEWFSDELGAYFFTVADLDQNERLEVIITTTQGTGLYTTNYYFEVEEAGEELIQWHIDKEEYESDPAIGYDSLPVFYNPEGEEYTYIVDSPFRGGPGESGLVIYGVNYANGQIYENILARELSTYSMTTEEEETKYYNENNEEIDQEKYIDLVQNSYQGWEEKVAYFQWISGAELDTEDLEESLKTLYDGFSIQ